MTDPYLLEIATREINNLVDVNIGIFLLDTYRNNMIAKISKLKNTESNEYMKDMYYYQLTIADHILQSYITRGEMYQPLLRFSRKIHIYNIDQMVGTKRHLHRQCVHYMAIYRNMLMTNQNYINLSSTYKSIGEIFNIYNGFVMMMDIVERILDNTPNEPFFYL